MNHNKCIIIEDVDQLILSYILDDPPTILALSQTNKYYESLLNETRTKINNAKFDFKKACEFNLLNLAKWIIKIDKPYVLIEGFTLAANKNHTEIIKWFLDMDSVILDVGCFFDRGFLRACQNGNLEIVKRLLHLLGNNNQYRYIGYGLLYACSNNHLTVAQYIVEFGDKKNLINHHLTQAFISACIYGHKDIAEWLIGLENDGYARIDIHYDMQYGNDEDEDNIPIMSSTAFNLACEGGYQNIAEWLIQIGVQRQSEIDIGDGYEGRMYAVCMQGRIETAKWLVEIGAKYFNQFDQPTLLKLFSYTCQYGQLSVAQWLLTLSEQLSKPINIHLKNDRPFRMACIQGNMAMAQWLFELGNQNYGKINLNVIDPDVIETICKNGHMHMMKWIIEISDNFDHDLITVDILDDSFKNKHFDLFKLLLIEKKNFHDQKYIREWFCYAYCNDDTELIKCLIEYDQSNNRLTGLCNSLEVIMKMLHQT